MGPLACSGWACRGAPQPGLAATSGSRTGRRTPGWRAGSLRPSPIHWVSAMNGFALTYESFDPAGEGLREALTSTGNGYLCSRGAAEWEDADGVHYPGTYVHGVYNRETTILGGLPVLNEDLVNLPNWLVLKLRIEGADAIRLAEVELLEYRHELDIHRAVVTRELRFRDAVGQCAPARVEKRLTFPTSRDGAPGDTLAKAGTSALWRPDFGEALERHV